MEFEILLRNDARKSKFIAVFEFDNPEQIPKGCKIKVTSKTLKTILDLPLEEVIIWLELLEDPPLNFKHFWFFCQRFSNGQFESGDNESYEKAELILNKLISRRYKIQELPHLEFSSSDKRKIELIQKALLDLECPLYKIPKIENKNRKLIKTIDAWNTWLDTRRDPNKVIGDWGNLEIQEDE